ncbi:MAG TPA: hypothetical protein VHT03_09425 [Rhizomicrobium sp.]|jgi:hypothetical protein|nr:hypothetical protein [Rhizomicrobium sp.]
MPPKLNPLKLNPLQLRTLTLLQVLARDPQSAGTGPGDGEMTIERFPSAHGAHLHFGDRVVAGRDASGLFNQKVWHALERKGLARTDWPHRITLTSSGLAYETGLAGELLQASPH